MKNNDIPTKDAGIAIVFSFASPANRLSTGPLARFTHMVHNPLYEVLLNHKSSKFIPLNAQGNLWQIKIVDANDNQCVFQWLLTKQTAGIINIIRHFFLDQP